MRPHCKICGSEITPSEGQRGGGNKKYCSPKCRRKSRALAEETWRKEDKSSNPGSTQEKAEKLASKGTMG